MSPSPADPRLRANYKVKTLFLFLFCASGRQMKGQRFLSECRNSRWMFALRSWPRRHEYRSYTLNISSAAVSTSSLPRFPRGWTSANALEQSVGILHSCKPNLYVCRFSYQRKLCTGWSFTFCKGDTTGHFFSCIWIQTRSFPQTNQVTFVPKLNQTINTQLSKDTK